MDLLGITSLILWDWSCCGHITKEESFTNLGETDSLKHFMSTYGHSHENTFSETSLHRPIAQLWIEKGEWSVAMTLRVTPIPGSLIGHLEVSSVI
jgi:hypothetical protein